MERTYTILLERGGNLATRYRGGSRALGQHFDSTARFAAEPPRPAVHLEKLTAQELQELSAEPEFVAAAEVMATRLLSPVAEAAAAPDAISVEGRRQRQSWGVAAVGADRSKYTGADVSVALLDTGIDAAHPAFRGVDLVERDFTGHGDGDECGHGTHCAGTIFGRAVDGVRIGVAPGVRRALIGKVLGPDGGNSDMLIRGLAWAHEQGAHVISMSVGLDFAMTVEQRTAEGWESSLATAVALEAYTANLRLLDRLLQMLRMQEPFTGGALLVAAAGNDSRRGVGGDHIMSACPPCGSDRIVSVGALDRASQGGSYQVSSFSNCGVELTAPGRDIVSAAAGGGLKVQSGTSTAAPHVAGVAALWWQAVRQSDLPANATLVRGKLLASAARDGFSLAVYPGDRGAGRVVAPRDSAAVSPRRAASERPRNAVEDTATDHAHQWAFGRQFEPISLDSQLVNLGRAGGGYLS